MKKELVGIKGKKKVLMFKKTQKVRFRIQSSDHCLPANRCRASSQLNPGMEPIVSITPCKKDWAKEGRKAGVSRKHMKRETDYTIAASAGVLCSAALLCKIDHLSSALWPYFHRNIGGICPRFFRVYTRANRSAHFCTPCAHSVPSAAHLSLSIGSIGSMKPA